MQFGLKLIHLKRSLVPALALSLGACGFKDTFRKSSPDDSLTASASPSFLVFNTSSNIQNASSKGQLVVEEMGEARSLFLKIQNATEKHLILSATGDFKSNSDWQRFLDGKTSLVFEGKILKSEENTRLAASSSAYEDAKCTMKTSGASEPNLRKLALNVECASSGSAGKISNQTSNLLNFTRSEKDNVALEIGTYNGENMWDDQTSPGFHYGDFDKTSNWYADQIIPTKVAHVTEAVALAGAPDVLALEEVESAENKSRTLEILKPELKKLGYRYFALGQQGDTNPTAVTTAVISRYPILSNERLDFVFSDASLPAKDDAELKTSSRDPQVATIAIGSSKIRVYASHWKSKGSASPSGDKMRLAVAQLIHLDIQKSKISDPSIDVLVMGDFNTDYFDSAVVTGLESTGNETLMLGSPTSKLYNLWFELPENDRCSYSFDGRRNCIDNILVSDGLFDKTGLSLIDNSFRVVGHQGLASQKLMNGNGLPYRWQTRKTAESGGAASTLHLGLGYSDHLPLVASYVSFDPNSPISVKSNKVTRSSPSLTDLASGPGPLDTIAKCETKNPKNLKQADLPNALALNQQCLEVPDVSLEIKLNPTDKRLVYVEIDGTKLNISATEAFTLNQSWLSEALNPLAGKGKITALLGRLGIQNGELTLFPSKPWTEIALQPNIPCTEISHVTVQLDKILATELSKYENTCVGFNKQSLSILDTSTVAGAVANVGTFDQFAVPTGLDLLTLRMFKAASSRIFAQPGTYFVNGFGRLTYFSPKKKWQINLNSFGQNSGEVKIAPAAVP
jgi:endonuclease/exonuclease/phosphatase family metal-dependent hydrolase